MSETRSPYITSDIPSDADTITEALAWFEAAGVTPRRLLMIAQACHKAKSRGWSRVTLTWSNGVPWLMYEEESRRW